MSQSLDTTTEQDKLFRRAALILLLLGFMSIGSSNIIGYLAAPSLVQIEPVPVVLIPVYFAAAYFTRKKSLPAYLTGLVAYVASSLIGFILSIVNFERASEMIGSGTFTGVTALNVIVFVIIASFLYNGYKALIIANEDIDNSSIEH